MPRKCNETRSLWINALRKSPDTTFKLPFFAAYLRQMHFFMIYVSLYFRLMSKMFGSGDLSGIWIPLLRFLAHTTAVFWVGAVVKNLLSLQKCLEKAKRPLQEHCSADTLTVCHEWRVICTNFRTNKSTCQSSGLERAAAPRHSFNTTCVDEIL